MISILQSILSIYAKLGYCSHKCSFYLAMVFLFRPTSESVPTPRSTETKSNSVFIYLCRPIYLRCLISLSPFI